MTQKMRYVDENENNLRRKFKTKIIKKRAGRKNEQYNRERKRTREYAVFRGFQRQRVLNRDKKHMRSTNPTNYEQQMVTGTHTCGISTPNRPLAVQYNAISIQKCLVVIISGAWQGELIILGPVLRQHAIP